MENNLKNKLLKIDKGKIIFVILSFCLLFGSIYIFNNIIGVKGSQSDLWPVVIYDGDLRISGFASSDNPKEIIRQNNLKVYPEDIIVSELITDPFADSGVGQKIIIRRSPYYYLKIDGKRLTVRTWDERVGEILKKSGVIIRKKDLISPARDKIINQGDYIVVTRINEEDVKVVEEVAFNTIYKGSSSIPFGQRQTIQEGVIGRIRKTYHVIYRNGIESQRWLKQSETIRAKRDKVIASGVIVGRANFGYYSGMVTSFYKGLTGHHLLVTNLANGKQVRVEIIGSGPFTGALMDMGTQPFQAIGGSLSAGYLPSVSVQLLD